MHKRLNIVLAALTLSIAACGGGGDDDSPSSTGSSSSSDYSALSGTWTSSALGASWTFNPDPQRVSTGVLRQRSTDGGSCQITYIEFTVDASSKTITYYGTRYVMTGNSGYNYDEKVVKGPYSTGYVLSGGSVTIGNGTYSKSSGSGICS